MRIKTLLKHGALGTALGCDPHTAPQTRPVPVVVIVNGDPGERVVGAEIYAGPTLVARSEAVRTRIPTAGLRLHEAASTRSPSISTMQARQLPSGR